MFQEKKCTFCDKVIASARKRHLVHCKSFKEALQECRDDVTEELKEEFEKQMGYIKKINERRHARDQAKKALHKKELRMKEKGKMNWQECCQYLCSKKFTIFFTSYAQAEALR